MRVRGLGRFAGARWYRVPPEASRAPKRLASRLQPPLRVTPEALARSR
jgi:hypothetical protein